MMGSLAEGLVGAVIGEATAQAGNRAPREGGPYAYQQQQQQLPQRPLATLVDSVTELGHRALAMTLKGVQYALLLEALLLSAAVLYGALYWLVMPPRLHDKPLYFDHSRNEQPSMCVFCSPQRGSATATVDFLAQHTQWDPSPLTKVERLHGKVLQPGQHYKVGLELDMPTTSANIDVGVFMVHTTLLDDEDNVLATSARPAMLPHTSALLKLVRVAVGWPLYLVGFLREADTVFVPCVDFYEENPLHPLAKARVSVSSGRVQFYRASVHITPQLKALPWLMHDWFYSTLGAGVLFIASLELMLVGFCYVFFLGLGDERSATGTPRAGQTNDGRRAAIRASARRYTNVTSSSSAIVGGRTVSPTGRSAASLTAEGLRRRDVGRVGNGSAASAAREVASGGGVIPPGVQAYQRGARFVVRDRDRGVGEAGGGVSGARTDASPPRVPQEELHAAAMASWAALGGNVDQGGDRTGSAGLNERGGDGMGGTGRVAIMDGAEEGRAAVVQRERGGSGRIVGAGQAGNTVETDGSNAGVAVRGGGVLG